MDKTTYVWVCCKRAAQVEMFESDMESLDGPEVKDMLDDVCRQLGPSNHIHIFKAPENLYYINVVIFECTV